MNITSISSNGNVFVNIENIKGIAFKKAALWVKCALLSVICVVFTILQDNRAQFSRIECLLPHNCPV